MKNKIAVRLTIYFTIILLLFTFIIGGVFSTLFKTHTIEMHKAELEKRAVAIAQSLSEYMEGFGLIFGRTNEIMSYLRHLDDIAMSDVWIVDQGYNLYIIGKMSDQEYQYKDLPNNIDEVVNQVFKGNITYSEGFSNLLDTPTLTVGAPIITRDRVIGALLLHSPVKGMDEAIGQGYEILSISLITALLIAFLLSIFFAFYFTKPLNRMKKTALLMAAGNYSAKTSIRRKDEIGELAKAMDVLSERLDLASKESEKLNQLRNDFVSNISHELRTPVTVMRGSLEALCDKVVTDPAQIEEYHRQMLNESMFLQRLVNDLLDLSRLQNLDFKIEMQELNLLDVINDVTRSARQIAQQRNIDISFDYDTKIYRFSGDYGRLRQMLLIVLDNSIKFSSEGQKVYVSLNNGNLAISNHGRGIDAEDLPYIFDRFYKIKSKENIGGTGLGLAIAKQIANRHNISITVNSIPNDITTFNFKFTK